MSGLVWRDFDPTGSLDKTSWADLDAWGLSLGFCVGCRLNSDSDLRFGVGCGVSSIRLQVISRI